MLARLGALGVTLTVLLTVGCTRADIGTGEARLRLEDGARAAVAVDGGPFAPATTDRLLRRSDRVHMTRGTGFLELRGGATVELRPGSDLNIGRTLTLRGGDALVTTRRSPARVAAAGTTAVIQPNSAARVRRGLAYEVAVYEGAAGVESASRTLRVPRLRAASVPAIGLLPARPSPIAVDSDDGWDRRYLGVAIQLTSELDGISDGFSTNVVTSLEPLRALLERAVPGATTRRGFDTVTTGGRRPGEVLVGLAIATSSGSTVRKVFGFRDDGASWGIVVLDQRRGDHNGMVGLLRRALDRAPVVFRTIGPVIALPPGGTISAPTATGGVASGSGSEAPPASGGSPPTTAPPGSGILVVPPAPGTPLDGETEDLIDGVVAVVDEVAVIVETGEGAAGDTVTGAVDATVEPDRVGSTTAGAPLP